MASEKALIMVCQELKVNELQEKNTHSDKATTTTTSLNSTEIHAEHNQEEQNDEKDALPAAQETTSSIRVVSDVCCFYLKFGTCNPPRPPCRWRHVRDNDDDDDDDDDDEEEETKAKRMCCFGATCRIGHATRALPKSASIEQRQAYWKAYYALVRPKKQQKETTQDSASTTSDKKNYNGKHPSTLSDSTDVPPPHIVGANPSVRDSQLLRSQLEPWTTSVLRDRLATVFDKDRTTLDPLPRGIIMEQLLDSYRQCGLAEQRNIMYVQGSPVRPELCQDLLKELYAWRDSFETDHSSNAANDDTTNSQSTSDTPKRRSKHQQQPSNTRPSLNAAKYVVFRNQQSFDQPNSRKARKAARLMQQHQTLWDLATQALKECDPGFDFSALAVTHQLQGSPHIDKQDTGPFYGLSLGDFRGTGGDNNAKDGGKLCVEAAWDTVARIDTHNRLAKVDGRFPHWVHAPYQGERFSLIYYVTTHQDYHQPTAGQAFWGTIVGRSTALSTTTPQTRFVTQPKLSEANSQ